MDAILIFSHGSVLCGAEANLLEIGARLQEGGRAPIVEIGFLNYSEPDYDTAVDRCVAAGADRIIIAPYFLVAGRFVTQDLPPRIAASQERHPTVRFVVAAPLGFHEALVEAVLSRAADGHPPARFRPEVEEIARFCRRSPLCPLYMAPGCLAPLVVPEEGA